jgi:uncharacterized membrane protein YgdD (TMEM256/DUF423 family)
MKSWLVIAALNGAVALLCGAFAAHGLQGRVAAHAQDIFQTGARYHMYHALAMGLAAFAIKDRAARPARLACALFLGGLVLFCGSLYALALGANAVMGFVTPIGGLTLLGGWIALAVAGSRLK